MKKNKGDVLWYFPGKKKPFAYSTVSTSLTIEVLYDEFQDLRIVYDKIKI